MRASSGDKEERISCTLSDGYQLDTKEVIGAEGTGRGGEEAGREEMKITLHLQLTTKLPRNRIRPAYPCLLPGPWLRLTSFRMKLILRRYYDIKLSWPILVEGDRKTPFSIATTPRCNKGCYSVPKIVPDRLDPYLIKQIVKQESVKYHLLSLWYDPTYDWTQVSRTIGKHSNSNTNGPFLWEDRTIKFQDRSIKN